MPVGPEKEKAIELAVSSIEKAFGKGSIMRLGNEEALVKDVQAVSTGSVSLDIALGVGGLPRGRIIEIYGPESSGKTTLALHAIAEAQKKGGIAAFVDAEHALDVPYARRLGVRTDDLLISQPDTGEQALEIAETLVRSGAIDVLVIDSVAALVPKAELEGEMGDAHMGVQARLMSQALRKLTGTISKSSTIVVFINQIRMKIGVMFGNPETTTGGNALKSCTARGSAARATSSTWPRRRASSTRAAPGSASGASASARGVSRRRPSCASTRRSSSRWRDGSTRSSGSGAARSRSRRPRSPRRRRAA
jgi:recombination protein RecA